MTWQAESRTSWRRLGARAGWLVALAVILFAVLAPLTACGPRRYSVSYSRGGYYQDPHYQGGYYQDRYYAAPRYQSAPSHRYRGVRAYSPGYPGVIVAPPPGYRGERGHGGGGGRGHGGGRPH